MRLQAYICALWLSSLPIAVTASICNMPSECALSLFRAERLLESTDYEEAAKEYLLLLSVMGKEPEQLKAAEQVRQRLAYTYFLAEKYSRAVELLADGEDPNSLYILALAYQKLQKDSAVVQTLKRYLAHENDTPLPYASEARVAMGIAYFHLGQYEEAGKQFRAVPKRETRPELYFLAQLYLARLSIPEKQDVAFSSLLQQCEALLKPAHSPDEIRYLQGLMAAHLAFHAEGKTPFLALAKQFLLEIRGAFADAALYLLGTLYFQTGDFQEAETAFAKLAAVYPQSPYASDSLLWAAASAEALNKPIGYIRSYRQTLFEKYPQSPHAAEAYFHSYSYRDYLQGDPPVLRHLQKFKEQFPESPYQLNASYLIGLSHKKQNPHLNHLLAAIDAFQAVETSFDTLYAKQLIPVDHLPYFIGVRYRASLEKALAHLAIAEASKGTKRDVYLEYAATLFEQLTQECKDPQHPLTSLLLSGEPYPRLLEASEFGLAQTHIKAQRDHKAEKILHHMLDRYRAAKITRGHFLSRTLYELGLLTMRHQDYSTALQWLLSAEDAAKGHVLNGDQYLDIWIQQSHCYCTLGQLHEAMRALSKGIDANVVSSLRLKAMFLRAEIYEQQGRMELARKQLEALIKKGGEWGRKAKMKLENMRLKNESPV